MKKLSLLFGALALVSLQANAGRGKGSTEPIIAAAFGLTAGYLAESMHADYQGTAQHTHGVREAGKSLSKFSLAFGSGMAFATACILSRRSVTYPNLAITTVTAAAMFAAMHYQTTQAYAAQQESTQAIAQAQAQPVIQPVVQPVMQPTQNVQPIKTN